jgi:hypothetical protein
MLQVIVLVLALLPSLARAEARIALAITNQAYTRPGAQLSNTHRGGEMVKAALEKVGFKVRVVKDTASEGALLQAIGDHVQRLAKAGSDAIGFPGGQRGASHGRGAALAARCVNQPEHA